MDDIVEECVAEEARAIVAESASEIVKEYIFLSAVDTFMESALKPIIADVARDAREEVAVGHMCDDFIAGLVGEIGRDLAAETLQEWELRSKMSKDLAEHAHVQLAAQRIIDRAALRQLSQMIASNGESILVGQMLDRLLESLVARTSLAKIKHQWQAQAELEANKPLGEMQHALAAQSAVDGLLGRLGSALEGFEDRLDRDEEEDAAAAAAAAAAVEAAAIEAAAVKAAAIEAADARAAAE